MRFFTALLFAGLLLPFGSANSATIVQRVAKMLDGVLVTGASSTFGPTKAGEKTFQATVTGTGAVTATVLVQVSNNPSVLGWITLGTITLSGTTTATDGFAADAGWAYYRGNVTAVTGTGAAVYLTVAQE